MARVAIRLQDLNPNPFKKYIRGGKLDEAKILRLVESIEQTGFWENVVCRKDNGRYELGYGHKRIEAAIRKLGRAHEIDIPCLKLTDDQMIQMMAMENVTGEEESVEAQVDVVRLAGKHLRERFEREKKLADPKTGKLATVANLPTDAAPDSAERISAFLGDKNWSRRKVSDLIHLEKLDPHILQGLRGQRWNEKAKTLGQQAGVELAKIESKETQKVIADTVAESEAHVTSDDIRGIVKTVKAAPKEKQHDVAVKAAIKTTDEVRARSGARKARRVKKKTRQDVTAIIASLLPSMRKLKKVYEEIVGAMENPKIGENFLQKPPYSVSVVVGEFHVLGDAIAKHHLRIFGKIKVKELSSGNKKRK